MEMSAPIIEQIMVGKPKTYGDKDAKNPMDREWTTGIVKHTVQGRIWAGETNLEGDGQGDRKNHGGVEKAIFVYPISHYAFWQEKLGRTDFTIGAFGENLAVQHMTEADVCIGDTFQIGDATVQVSQPRRPCWRPARRWRIKDLAIQIQREERTGWYFRVLKEGYIQAGDTLQLQERPYPEWTVATCNDVMYNQKRDRELSAKLAAVELLAPSWRNTLSKRAQGKTSSDKKRVIGPNE
ncbi:MOSC domain-containing protein [Lentibacillus cibarius]|uniref:MOSC domain-containing protein n=2 Tax=Lentibacillus cibarius TaxID=2583219 RepID=A0A549YG76_9BACI|nr:MOSC domain-containing protein [Lentibacillus cibarius]